ncbi:MAG: aminotransferase class IV [Bacteroidetes bacterium]|nr:aminotransferase class IV [Bacteroidota bacterium]MBL6943920.1 aminotransferase class IV [Bacteroidales bacterium]
MQLIETIRAEKGEFLNLNFHQNRMNNSRMELFNCTDKIDLKSILQNRSSEISTNQLYKCRIIYDTDIKNVEFVPYQLPDINFLKLVKCDEIEYSHKYYNRQQINVLFEQKGTADDIIIVKNGLITDSSFSNLLFYNGKQWLTPAFPLLKGTQRAFLLKQEIILTADIRLDDLLHFIKIRLINAMIKFEDEVDVEIENIIN